MRSLNSSFAGDADLAAHARTRARELADELGRPELADDAALVATELVTNAVLHGGGCTGVQLRAVEGGIRVEVRDKTSSHPMVAHESVDSLTGRGVRLISAVAARWGVDDQPTGKAVWAEITGSQQSAHEQLDEDELLRMWEDPPPEPSSSTFHIELGDVPTDLLLAAKSHVDGLVREFTLASAGAESGLTPEVPPHLASLLRAVVDRFADARLSIKRQALRGAARGDETTHLTLDLPGDAADAAEEYLAALDEVDAYCRARRLLTLETPAQQRVFRHWYVTQLVGQLRAAASGTRRPAPEPFHQRLLDEIGRLADAQRASDRAARLYAVAAALVVAATPEEVAGAAVSEGAAALGAAGGGVLLATGADHLAVPAVVGYAPDVVERLRNESPSADLPAAAALRTGEAVWLESRDERDERFPQLIGMEAGTVSLCAVPLQVRDRRLGALRFSFNQARLFDEDERRFVLALAAITAQALDRV